MSNHIHLIGEPKELKNLPKFMQGLSRSYTAYFNQRYKKVGHLWQGRFKSKVIIKDNYLIDCIHYIELNPVRANMVKTTGEYSWSSYKERVLSQGLNGRMLDPEKTVNLAYLASIKWFHRNPTFSEVSVISSLSSLYEKLSKLVKNIGMPRNDVVGSPVIEGAIFDKNLRICRKLQEGSRRNPYLKPLISPFFQVDELHI